MFGRGKPHMSHSATQRIMDDLLAKGRRIIDQTSAEAADDLRKQLSVPARAAADASFVISSAPGEFPRKRTGRLQASVFDRVVVDEGPRYFRQVGASAPHSKFLESGTRHMAARPHIRPINEKWRRILLDRLTAAFPK